MSKWWFKFEIDKNRFSAPFFYLVDELEDTWKDYQLLNNAKAGFNNPDILKPGLLANLSLSNIFLN